MDMSNTRAANARVAETLPLDDRSAFDAARRGWIASLPGAVVRADGGVIGGHLPTFCPPMSVYTFLEFHHANGSFLHLPYCILFFLTVPLL